MNCAYHPTNNAHANCHNCGKALCAVCDHRIKGFPFCQDCIVEGVETLRERSQFDSTSQANGFPLRRRVSPLIAGILSAVCPGLGAAYLGQTFKALTHFTIFIGLFQLSITRGSSVLFAFGMLAAWLFSIVDAWRAAKAQKSGNFIATENEMIFPRMQTKARNWGFLLVAAGSVLFLPIIFRANIFSLFLIALGVYLLVEHYKKGSTKTVSVGKAINNVPLTQFQSGEYPIFSDMPNAVQQSAPNTTHNFDENETTLVRDRVTKPLNFRQRR